jgi:transposase
VNRLKRRARHSEAEIAVAEALAGSARTAQQLRQAQAILLPALAGLSISATARVLGIGRNQVCVLRRSFREAGGPTFADHDRRGGRHRELMSIDEEKTFIASWTARPPMAGPSNIPAMHAAYEAAVGRRVARSTLYRLLQRHGLRAPGRANGNGQAREPAIGKPRTNADARPGGIAQEPKA